MSQEPVNRARRAVFVFATTAFCVVIPSAMAFFGLDTSIADMVAEGLIGIAQITVVTYLGASVIDRSNVLSKIGDAVSGGARGGAG